MFGHRGSFHHWASLCFLLSDIHWHGQRHHKGRQQLRCPHQQEMVWKGQPSMFAAKSAEANPAEVQF